MRGILAFLAADSGDVVVLSSFSLLTFFARCDLLYAECATGLFIETYPIASKGVRSSMGATNVGWGGCGPSGSATSPQFGSKDAQLSRKYRHFAAHWWVGGANGLALGNSPIGRERVVCDASDSLRRTGLLGASVGSSEWPREGGFSAKSADFWF